MNDTLPSGITQPFENNNLSPATPEQQSTEVLTQNSKPKKLSGWVRYIIFFVVLVLLGIFGVIFFPQTKKIIKQVAERNISSQSKPTPSGGAVQVSTSWTTYTNPKIRFSLSLPPKIRISDSESEDHVVFSSDIPKNVECIQDCDKKATFEYTIDIYRLSPSNLDTSVDERIGQLQKTSEQQGQVIGKKSTEFAGRNAVVFESECSSWCKEIFVRYDAKTIIRIVTRFPTRADSVNPEVDQILSTFRFVGAANTPDTIQWITYTDSQTGFAFKHPPQFNHVDPEAPKYSYIGKTVVTLRSLQTEYSTNNYLQESVFAVSVERNKEKSASCLFNENGEPLLNTRSIGDNIFFEDRRSGVAAGSSHESTLYRAIRDKNCLEIALTVFVRSDFVSIDFDKATKSQQSAKNLLDQVLSTVKFL